MKNLFLQAVTTIDIDIFGDLRPAESQTSNCRQFLKFFKTHLRFSYGIFTCSKFGSKPYKD